MKKQTVKIGTFKLVKTSELRGSRLNREIDYKHVDKMANKILSEGFTQPITIAPEGDVIEGAHRTLAAKQLKLKEVPCYIVDWVKVGKDEDYLDSIIKMNNSNKSWLNNDYLQSWSNTNEDYSYVLDKYKNSNLSIGLVVFCYFKKANQSFKQGKAYIEDKTLSDALFTALDRLRVSYGKNVMQSYALRDVITSFHSSKNKSIELVNYIESELDDMAKGNDSRLQNIKDFKETFKRRLDKFNS